MLGYINTGHLSALQNWLKRTGRNARLGIRKQNISGGIEMDTICVVARDLERYERAEEKRVMAEMRVTDEITELVTDKNSDFYADSARGFVCALDVGDVIRTDLEKRFDEAIQKRDAVQVMNLFLQISLRGNLALARAYVEK